MSNSYDFYKDKKRPVQQLFNFAQIAQIDSVRRGYKRLCCADRAFSLCNVLGVKRKYRLCSKTEVRAGRSVRCFFKLAHLAWGGGWSWCSLSAPIS